MSEEIGRHSQSLSRESSADVHGNSFASTGAAQGSHGTTVTDNTQTAQLNKKDAGAVRYLRACDNCRRRKVKCDGVRPSCSHCRRVEVPCHYSIKPKSRRMWKCLETPESSAASGATASAGASDKKALDETTAKLMARVETMERLLMQRNGVNSPRIPAGLGAMGDDIAANVIANSGSAQLSLQSGQRSGSRADSGYVYSGTNGNFSNSNGAPPSQIGLLERRDSESRSADLHTQASLLSSTLNGDRQGSSSDSHAYLQASGTSMGTLPPDVVNDLIDTLFSGASHIVELLNEQSFRKQYAAGTISPLLFYSSLASAARYSKHPAIRSDPPYSASAPFINRAKTLVMDAVEEPSLGNAQGLMIMCMMHFALGNEVVTTSYKALALNMCIMLGFNRLDSVNGPIQPNSNCSHEMLPTSTMSMDWVDREAARRLWWTIFSIENYSSVCMGLAPSIQAEYCDVNLPASTQEWMQGKPLSEASPDGPNKRMRLTNNPINQLSAYHAQLSLIFSKVAWLVTRTNADSSEAVSQFSELNTVLQRWYEGLPKELRLSSVDTLLYGNQDSGDYYQICVLHIRFYAAVIQLNHAITEFTEDPSIIEPGQRKCVIAASRISDLLRSSFEIPVETRDINWYMCVFRAAHIHIYRLLSRDPESIARAKQDLAIHRRHLREGGPLWRVCYKLLNRLDDMEQMVMLLPAQIPMADLIKIKNITRKGKSQLVNMQLDALIKPSLIHSEHADSEDLPLAARIESASAGKPLNRAAASAGGQSLPAAVDGGTAEMSELYGMISHTKNSSPESTNSGSTAVSQMQQLTSMSATSLPVAPSVPQASVNMFGGTGPPLGQMSGDKQGAPQMPSRTGTDSHASLTNISAPMLQIANELPAINTNIVIDNNMAETLVNYFYMVASNSQAMQSPSLGPGQGQQFPSGQEGSPQVLSSSSTAPSFPSAMSAAAAEASGQQQPSLFSGTYDLSQLQTLAENNSRSFI
ncbi:hypothetical protein IWW42_000475 [Coemansia sp. RSA 1085]|nr:fungal-specific transcription factor domain-containing protein [Coemansia mojavensis]KAJ2676600.1 hypothetical protein IWW42_000475 [Coemansia sp. RSA 1085]